MTRPRLLAVLVVAAAVSAGCTAGVNSEPDTTDAPTTTIVVTGSTDELLDRLLTSVGEISEAIIGDGDQQAFLAEAEAVWDAVRPAVEASDAVAAESMQSMMDLARVAVERKRPADADKATKFLTDLVTAYTTP